MKALHLGYHYVRDRDAPGANCPPSRLQRQISELQEEGFEILTCGEVALRLLRGKPLPEKHATLSFDDGLKDQVTTALPILKEFGVPATFFVITCALDGQIPPVIGFQIAINKLGAARIEEEILPQLLDELGAWSYCALLDARRFDHSGMKMGEPPEMRRIKAVFNHFIPPSLQAELLAKMFSRYDIGSESALIADWFLNSGDVWAMVNAGMEIAAHTVKHPWLSMIGEGEIEAEAAASKRRLEQIVGDQVFSFAWTFGGAVRREAQLAVLRAGYTSAWNFWSAWKQMPEKPYQNLLDIPRLIEGVYPP